MLSLNEASGDGFETAVRSILDASPGIEVTDYPNKDNSFDFSLTARGCSLLDDGGYVVEISTASVTDRVINRVALAATRLFGAKPILIVPKASPKWMKEAREFGVVLWDETTLGSLARLAGVPYPPGAASMVEGSIQSGSAVLQQPEGTPEGRVTLSVEVDRFGWHRAADAFVLPAGIGGVMTGATARNFLQDVGQGVEDDILRERPEFFSIDTPYAVSLPPPYTRHLIVVTAYGDGIHPERAFLAAIRLAAQRGFRHVMVPLLGAAQLGEATALRRMLATVPGLPPVSLHITLVVVSEDLARLAQKLIDDMADREPGIEPAPMRAGPRAAGFGFANDEAEGTDLLGVKQQAESFARLLAAKKVKTPLAVGLFGNWGSGKSFFMNLIREHLKVLCGGTLADNVDPKISQMPYYRGVAPITFNAWHYTDSELWPSLALRIFDGVAAFMAGEDKDEADKETVSLRQDLARKVASNERARSEAEQSLADAQKQRAELQDELLKAEEARGVSARAFRFDGLAPDMLKGAADVLSAAGLPGASASLKQAEQALADARHVAGKLTFMFPWRWPGQYLPWVLAVGAVLLVAAVFGIHALVTTYFQEQVASILAVLAPVTLAGGEVVRRLGTARKTVDELAALVDKARKAAAKTPVVDGNGAALNTCDARIATARAKLAQCDQAIADASRRLQEIESGALVYDFLRERAASDHYRNRLGVVSMLRQDLESLQGKLKALEDVVQGDAKRAFVPVRRIVLFIDDLDRCEPDQVVDVLQAVHLLLAFPLFAVIVAVDPRWLERSLYKRYLPGFESMSEDARSASEFSPHNYLEKIFQIPYRVPGMNADGFRALILSHAPLFEGESPDAAGENSEQQETREPDSPAPERDGTDDAEPEARADAPSTETASPEENADSVQLKKAPADAAAPERPPEFSLHPDEREFLARLHAFAATPRAVKRLLNVYVLLRLQISMMSDDGNAAGTGWGAFLAGGHRAAALLLAMDVGFPVVTRMLRHAILNDGRELLEAIDKLQGELPKDSELLQQCAALREAVRRLGGLPDFRDIRRWVAQVGRFCFHEPCSYEELQWEMAVRRPPVPEEGG